MHISNINNQSFKGRIILKGDYPSSIKNVLLSNPYIKKLENLADDVSLSISKREVSLREQVRCLKDEEEFKIFLKKDKKCDTILKKMADKLFNKAKPLTKNYHSMNTTIAVLSKYIDDEWLAKLGFKI